VTSGEWVSRDEGRGIGNACGGLILESTRVHALCWAWQESSGLRMSSHGRRRGLSPERFYRVSRSGPLALDYGLARQIRGAAVSVMANIAEGFERSGRRELIQFIAVSKSSCGEVLSHLYVALDAGYLSPADFEDLKAKTEEVARILGGLRGALMAKRLGTRPAP
jgi:four helix bundle protein